MKTVKLVFDNLPDDLPDDVLIEHLAVALRKLVEERPVKAPPKPTVRKDYSGGGYIPRTPGYEPWWLPAAPNPMWKTTSTGRNHPFEGPEVNDDLPEGFDGKNVEGVVYGLVDGPTNFGPKTTAAMSQVMRAVGEDFPLLAELFRDKRAEQPKAEGDWQLKDDDKVGED